MKIRRRVNIGTSTWLKRGIESAHNNKNVVRSGQVTDGAGRGKPKAEILLSNQIGSDRVNISTSEVLLVAMRLLNSCSANICYRQKCPNGYGSV